MTDESDILLVYDKQCPACDFYCTLARVRESVGNLVLVDAREDSAVMGEITAAGLDIVQGMVLKIGSQLYYGADAINKPSGRYKKSLAILLACVCAADRLTE